MASADGVVGYSPKPHALIWLNLTSVYIIWGSTYAAIAVTGETLPPLGGMGIRFVVGAALMATLLMLRGRSLRITRTEFSGVAQVAVLLLVIGIGGVSMAERVVPTGYVSLLICGTPLWMAIFRTLHGDRPSWRSIAGVVIGLVGMFALVLSGQPANPGHSAEAVLPWSLVVLAGSACWSWGSFRAQRLVMPKDPLVLTVWEMLVGGIVLLVLSAVLREPWDLGSVTMSSWAGLAYLIVFGSLIGYSSYTWLLANARISLVATYAYVNPIVAVAIGTLLLAEPVTSGMMLGGAIVLLGVILTVSAERPAKH